SALRKSQERAQGNRIWARWLGFVMPVLGTRLSGFAFVALGTSLRRVRAPSRAVTRGLVPRVHVLLLPPRRRGCAGRGPRMTMKTSEAGRVPQPPLLNRTAVCL